jgi:proteasome lid subunit RPN8/RPN11
LQETAYISGPWKRRNDKSLGRRKGAGKMRKRKVLGIARDTLRFILEASRSSLPNEFAGLLSVEDEIITEVLILPGTENSRMSALVRLYMLPNMAVAGSAHSHPNGDLRPSEQDIIFFSRTGDYHLIVGPPFEEQSFVCYDGSGKRRDLAILDVEFKDDGFEDDFEDEFDDKFQEESP